MSESQKSYSSKNAENTRVKVKQRKKTVGITVPLNIVKRARKHNLNISRITESSSQHFRLLGKFKTDKYVEMRKHFSATQTGR